MANNTHQPGRAASRPWQPWLVQGLLLMSLWLLLSGHYDAFHIALGVLSVGIVLAINRKTCGLSQCPQGQRLRLGRLLLYLPWLAWEMVLAALHVARVVLTPRPLLRPTVVRFKSAQPNDGAKVILGNSITLTPGTLTLDIEGDEFIVHCLTRQTAASLLAGTMQHRVARLFTQDHAGNMVFDAHEERSAR